MVVSSCPYAKFFWRRESLCQFTGVGIPIIDIPIYRLLILVPTAVYWCRDTDCGFIDLLMSDLLMYSTSIESIVGYLI